MSHLGSPIMLSMAPGCARNQEILAKLILLAFSLRKMGQNISQQLLDLVNSGDGEVGEIFNSLDKDGSGGLDRKEWLNAAQAFHEAIREAAVTKVKAEVRDSFSAKANPMMGYLIGKMAATSVDLFEEEQQIDVNQWVDSLFSMADKDADGTISLEEFRVFMIEAAPALKKEHAIELRNAVADNMEQNDGCIDKTFSSKSIRVDSSGVSSDSIRKGN